MNEQISNITGWLESDRTLEQAEVALQSNPDLTYPVNNITIRLDETVELFNYLKELILQLITSGKFEKLPTSIQSNIHNQIQAIFQNKTNVNQVMVHIQALYSQVLVAGLEKKLDSYENYKRALSDISNLRRAYARAIGNLDDLTEKVKTIEKNYNDSQELIKEVVENKIEIDDKLNKSNKNLETSRIIHSQIEKSDQEIQNIKKEILAFKSNIESYKNDINSSTESSNSIIMDFERMRDNVDKLIADAEAALQLKSSQGISAALSTQYENENKRIKKVSWLFASVVFLLFALIGVLLLLIDFEFENLKIVNDGVNSIVARVVFVGISITGATFSANQYNKQKYLADNYAYKLVLAKSILAFTKEIKKYNPDKAADYMKDVLSEINKSPIEKIKEDGLNKKDIGLIQQIVDIFIKSK